MLTTDQKGTIAEYGIAWTAIKLGIDVYKPLNDGTRCDLIFDLGGKLRGFSASGRRARATR